MKKKLALNKFKISTLNLYRIRGKDGGISVDDRNSIDDDSSHTAPSINCPTNDCLTEQNCNTADCYTQNIDPNTNCITGNG